MSDSQKVPCAFYYSEPWADLVDFSRTSWQPKRRKSWPSWPSSMRLNHSNLLHHPHDQHRLHRPPRRFALPESPNTCRRLNRPDPSVPVDFLTPTRDRLHHHLNPRLLTLAPVAVAASTYSTCRNASQKQKLALLAIMGYDAYHDND